MQALVQVHVCFVTFKPSHNVIFISNDFPPRSPKQTTNMSSLIYEQHLELIACLLEISSSKSNLDKEQRKEVRTMKAPQLFDQETLNKQGFFSLRKSWQSGDERVFY